MRYWAGIVFIVLVTFEMFRKAYGKEQQFLQMTAGSLLASSRIFMALTAAYPLRGTLVLAGKETVFPKILFIGVPGVCLSLLGIMVCVVMVYRSKDFKHSAIVSSFLVGQVAYTINFILTLITVVWTSYEATIYYFVLDVSCALLCANHNFM